MRIFVIEVLGGGTLHIAKKTKEEAIKWFFDTYPYRNFTDIYEQ